MRPEPRTVQRVYLVLMLFNTLAASFIWGINTLFLLDAGLSSTAAFGANALFTAGMVAFEVPTGVVADTWGRRHRGPPRLLPAGGGDPGHLHRPVLDGLARPRPVLGLGGDVGAARPGVHLLLGGGRGLAGRRPQVHRLQGQPRVGLR